MGAKAVNAKKTIEKYTAGGLIPQGGIVIGLVLLLNQYPQFDPFFEILLTIVMGAVIINELIGPMTARYSLYKTGDIEKNSSES